MAELAKIETIDEDTRVSLLQTIEDVETVEQRLALKQIEKNSKSERLRNLARRLRAFSTKVAAQRE